KLELEVTPAQPPRRTRLRSSGHDRSGKRRTPVTRLRAGSCADLDPGSADRRGVPRRPGPLPGARLSSRAGAVALAGGFAAGADRLAHLAPGQTLLARSAHRFGKLFLGGVTSPGGELDRHRGREGRVLIAGLRVVVLEGVGELVGTSLDVFNGASSHGGSPQILGSGHRFRLHVTSLLVARELAERHRALAHTVPRCTPYRGARAFALTSCERAVRIASTSSSVRRVRGRFCSRKTTGQRPILLSRGSRVCLLRCLVDFFGGGSNRGAHCPLLEQIGWWRIRDGAHRLGRVAKRRLTHATEGCSPM